MKDIMERFRTGESDTAEIPLPSGETLKPTRDEGSPGGFHRSFSRGGPTMRSVPFEAGPTRPGGYPEDLPFLAETAVSLTEVEGQSLRTLTWFKIEDPNESLAALRLQSATDGWEELDESRFSTAHGTMTSIEFGKGELRRTFMLNRFGEHSVVKLIEHSKKGCQGRGPRGSGPQSPRTLNVRRSGGDRIGEGHRD